MRVAVLPREVSARVITSSVARAAGVVNAVSLALAVPILFEFVNARGILEHPPIPFVILAVLLALSITVAAKPTPAVLGAFLVVGFVGAVLFQLTLLEAYPRMIDEGLFILNRPAVALGLVTARATTIRTGIVWALAGFALSNLVTLTVSVVAGVSFRTGFGPFLTLLFLLTVYTALGVTQVSLRKRVPDFDQLERVTVREEIDETMRVRVTAVVHDTLLNDLALVMNAPNELEPRMIERLKSDLDTLTGSQWRQESSGITTDDQDSELRNRVMLLVSEMQWRGLTVHVTGSGNGIYRVADEVGALALDIVRVCLENVLRHSGVRVAELDLGYQAHAITVMITDHGVGFDPHAVPADRLGLRNSVRERVRIAGGDVKVWSTPGNGTSVIATLPITEIVTQHEESDHGRS